MYGFYYEPATGKILSVKRLSDGASIPLCKDNTDYQAFLKWNSEQATPLDLESTIEVVKPEPPRDLDKLVDELFARVNAIEPTNLIEYKESVAKEIDEIKAALKSAKIIVA